MALKRIVVPAAIKLSVRAAWIVRRAVICCDDRARRSQRSIRTTTPNLNVAEHDRILWLASCYFAHNSLRFPALLPFFNASSRRPFHYLIAILTQLLQPGGVRSLVALGLPVDES
jgi:hypothetical protein